MKRITQDQFEDHLIRLNLSERTRKEYLYYFEKFGGAELNEITGNNFVDRYKNNPVAKAFIKNLRSYYIHVLKMPILWEFLKTTGRNPVKIPKVISSIEVDQISIAMNNQRNSLMLLLSFACGLRISEMINIKMKDFNWGIWCNDIKKLGHLRILGKGDKERIVLVPRKLMLATLEYINQHKISGKLFNIKGNRWRDILAFYSKKALGRRINPHLLRHSCATHFLDNGMDLQYIRDFLGHKSIVSTQIYTHTSLKNLERNVGKVWETT